MKWGETQNLALFILHLILGKTTQLKADSLRVDVVNGPDSADGIGRLGGRAGELKPAQLHVAAQGQRKRELATLGPRRMEQ